MACEICMLRTLALTLMSKYKVDKTPLFSFPIVDRRIYGSVRQQQSSEDRKRR